MDTKKELVERLSVLMPGMAEEIASIIGEYRISREPSRERGGLDRKVAAFLAAKKIDGLSPKTLKNYREMLGAFAARWRSQSPGLIQTISGIYRLFGPRAGTEG